MYVCMYIYIYIYIYIYTCIYIYVYPNSDISDRAGKVAEGRAGLRERSDREREEGTLMLLL